MEVEELSAELKGTKLYAKSAGKLCLISSKVLKGGLLNGLTVLNHQ